MLSPKTIKSLDQSWRESFRHEDLTLLSAVEDQRRTFNKLYLASLKHGGDDTCRKILLALDNEINELKVEIDQLAGKEPNQRFVIGVRHDRPASSNNPTTPRSVSFVLAGSVNKGSVSGDRDIISPVPQQQSVGNQTEAVNCDWRTDKPGEDDTRPANG